MIESISLFIQLSIIIDFEPTYDQGNVLALPYQTYKQRIPGLLPDRFLLGGLCFWSRPVQHLQNLGGFGPHARVDVGFGALDVVVQIVPEHVDQVDGVVAGGAVGVAGEQDEGDVAYVVSDAGVCVLKLQRRLPMAEHHLGR